MTTSPKPKPTLLPISNALSLRYERTGDAPPLVLMHTIRTQLEYFRTLAPVLAKSFSVYAIDLPGHGHSPIDPLAPLDEPYFRQAVVGFIEKLDLTNWFTNVIVGSLQIPVLGAFNAWLENKMVLGKIMGGGYHDARKLPPDLLTEFDEVARRPGCKRAARKVLAGWQSWSKARDQYGAISAPVTLIYGDSDWSRPDERERTRELLPNARMVTLKDTGHFASVENPSELARVVLG